MKDEQKRTIGDETDLEQLKDDFKSKPDPVKLHINRVPRDISKRFKNFADEHFAGDYGMALTFLMKEEDIMEKVNRQIEAQEQRIEKLEQIVHTLINDEDEDDDEEGLNTLN